MRSIKSAKKSYLLNVPCNFLYGLLLTILGITLYSYFYVIKCDPYEAGLISNRNQMVLVFMFHILQDFPGLRGLYMATIFSGALSTLSSGINALSANTVEDIFAGCLRGISEKTVTILAKMMVFVYGLGIVGVTYLARSLEGPVTQMGASVFGACGSAVLGMFILGCTVPWANKYGAFVGGFLSVIMNFWIVIGSKLFGRKLKTLPSLTTEECYMLSDDDSAFNSTSLSLESNVTSLYATISSLLYNNDPYDYSFFLYDVSYEWYAVIGTFVCIMIGLVVSKLTGGKSKSKVDAKLILPMLRKFWRLDELPSDDENELKSI